ncbi:MAG: amidohydrolase family protein [Phycisphaerales bacterium]
MALKRGIDGIRMAVLGVLVCGLVWSSPAGAQDLTVRAPAQDRAVLLVGGVVHPVSGDAIDDGWVLFDGGRILGVGAGTPARADLRGLNGVRRVELDGLHVYPGLVGANTVMGLMEIGAVRATVDYSETGSVTPEVLALNAVNPDSTIIPVTRTNGVLTVGVMPTGGVVPGRASVLRMEGWTHEDMGVLADAGLVVSWPSLRVQTGWWVQSSEKEQRERAMERVERIHALFDEARAYLAARDAADEDRPVAMDLRFEAMRGVLAGERPVFVRAEELEQILSAIRFGREQGVKVVIVGGRDADLCAEELKEAGVGVIVAGTHRLPKRRDSEFDHIFRLPGALEAAGVRYCIASTGGSFETPHERNLPYHAASAVAFGLDVDAAIRSITLSAAELLGVGDELGSLEAGKAATLIVTDGNPLEVTTEVVMAFVDGRAIDLTNKQTALYEKYREKYRQLGLIEGGDDGGGDGDGGE